MRKQASIDACGGRADMACASASRRRRSDLVRAGVACVLVPLAMLSPACRGAQGNDSNRVTSALTKAADKTGAALKRGAQAVGPAIDTGVSKTEKGIKKGVAFVGREFERAGKKMQGEYQSHVDPSQNSNAK